MRLLHISREFYPLMGGTGKHIYEIGRRLQEKGYACRIVTLCYDLFNKSRKFPPFEIIDGLEVFRLKGWGHYKKPLPLEIPWKLFHWADIVHLHDPRFLFETTALLKPFFRYKIAFTSHGFILHTPQWRWVKKLLTATYYKFYLKNIVDAVICVSRQDFGYFEPWGVNQLYLIENGIDYKKYSQIKKSPQAGHFLYFGRLDWNKGLDLLLVTMAALKDIPWTLDIVGKGSEEITLSLQEMAANLGLKERVNWHGFLPEKELLSFISRSELCFFPSRYEGFGFALLEAMAAGAVCLANKIQSFSQLINDQENGFLLDFSTPSEAAKRIREIISLPSQKLRQIAEQAKALASRYDWGKKLACLLDVYNRMRA